jgi:hypothetical protein
MVENVYRISSLICTEIYIQFILRICFYIVCIFGKVNLTFLYHDTDHLCGLVVRVPGYRPRGPGFDFRHYQIFWEGVGLERGPLSLVSTNEEVLGRNSSGSSLESRQYGYRDLLRWQRDNLYMQKLALTLPTGSGHSVGIVRSRTNVMEFVCLFVIPWHLPSK